MPVKIVSDYAAGTFDVFYNGVPAASDIGFQTAGSDAVNDVWIGVQNDVVGNSMFVDDLSVTAVPEPGLLALVGVVGAALARCRRGSRQKGL